MTFKTKIFSLIALSLLVLPVFLAPQRNGQVLGAREGSVQTSDEMTNVDRARAGITPAAQGSVSRSQEDQVFVEEIPKSVKLGEIGSGVRSVRALDETENSTQIYSGKAIWNKEAKVAVSTDKFPLGESIKATAGDKSMSLVVQSRPILSTDTILVLDTKTFQELGGDPERGEIQVQVTLDR